MKKSPFKYVTAFLFMLLPHSVFSQVIDEESKYIVVETDVIDSVKLHKLELKRKKAGDLIKKLSSSKDILEQLIVIGKADGKIPYNDLHAHAKKIHENYLSFKDSIVARKNDIHWITNNKMRIDAVEALKDNEKIVSKMLNKQKVSSFFVPYLSALMTQITNAINITKKWGYNISPEENPYKKGTKEIQNPHNRNYCYINNYSYLDSLDLRTQIKDWEWAYTETSEEAFTAYPRSIHYNKYKSHPEYRVIGDKVFNAEGNLICQINIMRSDGYIIRDLKEELLKAIYINDYKSNKYDILKASAKTQENVKLMLGLPFKSFVDKKTAARNQKIIKDAFRTRAEADLKHGTYEQRARAKREAEKADLKLGMLMFEQMLDKDYNAANNFKNQLEKDHKEDLYGIYKISRVSYTSFKVAFMNKDNKSSYTGLVTIKQTGKYQYDYEYKLIPNDQTVEINPSDYPKIVQQDSTPKRRRY